MTGIEAGELRNVIERIDKDEHNGIHIIGWFPLSEALIKAGYRKESNTAAEILSSVEHELSAKGITVPGEVLSGIRERYTG